MEVLDGPSDAEFEKAVKGLGILQGKVMEQFKYAIVMAEAERSLHAVFLYERPDLGHVRK